MPIDYSRWDGLELSDDDDFECHPNVDKGSMVRWKQADIHRRRRLDKDNLQALKRELVMIDDALTNLHRDHDNVLNGTLSIEELQTAANEEYGLMVQRIDEKYEEEMSKDRDPRWGPYTKDQFVMERVDLGKEIAEVCQNSGDSADYPNKASNKIKEIIEKLKERKGNVEEYIRTKEEEAARKITFDDLTTGFSRTVIAKPPPAKDNTKDGEQAKGVGPYLGSSGDAAEDGEDIPENADFDSFCNGVETSIDVDVDYITDENARKFSKLQSLDDTKRFLMDHPKIIDNSISDMILVEAFKLRMLDKVGESKLCIRQSSIIRYILTLGSLDLERAIDALTDAKKYSSHYFYSDIAQTYERITKRVEAIRARNEHHKKMIEDYADSIKRPDGTFSPPPIKGDIRNMDQEKREELFAKLPPHVQRSIIVRNTEEINNYLASLSLEEGERVLKEWDDAGFIVIDSDYIEEGGQRPASSTNEDNPSMRESQTSPNTAVLPEGSLPHGAPKPSPTTASAT